MIADRCQGQQRKVACRSGRAQGKDRMSKEKARKRGPRGQREVIAQRSNMDRFRGQKTEGNRIEKSRMKSV